VSKRARDLLFDPARRDVARALHDGVADLVCTHGHVDPWLLARPNATLGTPAQLLVTGDHYVFRLLHSQGVALEDLGLPARDGTPVERDDRRIWQRFADRFTVFAGTPTCVWLAHQLREVFGIDREISSGNAQLVYDELEERLARPEFAPRALLDRFTVEVLCTADAVTDDLAAHQALHEQGLAERVRPTLRADPRGKATADDANAFAAHMLVELARMSREDGLVLQLHAGSLRDHHAGSLARFGHDIGADIPVATDWTRNLQPLLGEYGDDPSFRLIAFTLDESTLSRELAPLAGYYPALCLGAPGWFLDSPGGIRRFLDATAEVCGLANLAGFVDDARAFTSIPARHDLWRRVCCDWLAGLVLTGRLSECDAHRLARELAVELARRAYRLPRP
jgi:glucuronate isomerase